MTTDTPGPSHAERQLPSRTVYLVDMRANRNGIVPLC